MSKLLFLYRFQIGGVSITLYELKKNELNDFKNERYYWMVLFLNPK